METAFVLLSCDMGSELDVIEKLKDIDSVKQTYETFGAHDIIAKIENSEKKKLKEIINWNIRKIDHVSSTLTLISTQ